MEQKTATPPKPASTGPGCLALFGVPFAAIGTLMAYLAFSSIIKSVIMSGWPTVPAQLNSVELKASHGSKSTTYSVAAAYNFEFEGKQYSGTRTSLYANDNIGSFHQDFYAELSGKKDRGEPITIHVNPADPTQSIINPNLRLGMVAFYMIFVVTFGGVGWGLIAMVYLARRKDKVTRALQMNYPMHPWMWNPQWKDKKILSQQKMLGRVLVALAIFWNTVSLPVLFVVPRELEQGNYIALGILIFPLIGAGLIYAAVEAVLRGRRFGKAWFELQTLPVRPGTPLRGIVHSGKRLEGVTNMTAHLRCFQTRRSTKRRTLITTYGTSKQSDNEPGSTSITWESKLDIPVSQIGSGVDDSTVRIEIALPQDARPCCELQSSQDGIIWKLSVHATLAGPDFAAEFEIPVFE